MQASTEKLCLLAGGEGVCKAPNQEITHTERESQNSVLGNGLRIDGFLEGFFLYSCSRWRNDGFCFNPAL